MSKDLQVFLELYNYSNCFVHCFAEISAPLYDFPHKEATWHYIDTEELAMPSLFTVLCTHPVYSLPDFTKLL